MNTLSLSNIDFSYHSKKVLNHLSLSVAAGSCVAIVGENGCGKSTLLSILAGIRKANSGDYRLDDTPINSKAIHTNIGYVPQENPLLPDLTVKDNLRLWYADTPYSYELDMKEGILTMLHLDDILPTPVWKLSGGMKKRVSFAIALSHHPSVLLLDEPSTALDLVCKRDIHSYLEVYKQQGGTILFTTHEEADLSLCDYLYVLQNGTLTALPVTTRGEALLQALQS